MAKRPVPLYDFKAFGAAIKAARNEYGESRKKVSDELYISPRYLANIENKGQQPSLQVFYDLVTRYHISVDQFFFPNSNAEKSTGRRQLDALLDGMSDKGIPTPSQRKRDLGSKRQLWNSDRLQNEWSDTAVTRILRDERYTGKLIGIKTTRTELGNQNSSRKQSKEDWIVVPGAFEAIISQETFDEAQRQLERLRRRLGKRETNAPAVHLFSRKLKCGHCGLALGRHVVELGVYYRCEGRAWNSGAACLGARLFEDDLIRTVLASIRFQARLAGKVEERLDKVENAERRERETLWEQRRRVQMKLEHLTTQKAEAFLLFNQGDLTPKAYDATCAKLDKAILEQRAKLLDMSGTQTSTQDSAALHCREDIARLKELSNLRTLDRQTVEKLIQSIRVYDGKRIEIVWNFSDSYMKLLTREEQNHEE